MAIGFGGQIAGRLLALKLALALDRKAVFRHRADPPYLQTLEPQYSNAPDLDWSLAEIFDPLLRQQAKCLRLDYAAASASLANHGGVEGWAQKSVVERYAIVDGVTADGEILNWMRLLPSVQLEIDAARARLGVSSNTLGVHLRRGDKTVETAYVPAKHFNAAIARIHQTWRFDSIYLASDSPDAPSEIEAPRGVKLIFDSEEKRYNNANHKMLFRNPDLARQETFTAVKTLALLSACGGIVGQDNAHFATLASAVITSKLRDRTRIILLPGKLAEFESSVLARYFDVKRSVRGFIRSCLPNHWRMRLVRFKLF